MLLGAAVFSAGVSIPFLGASAEKEPVWIPGIAMQWSVRYEGLKAQQTYWKNWRFVFWHDLAGKVVYPIRKDGYHGHTASEKHQEITEIIFVGDSRVVGQSGVGGQYYVGRESMGYDWMAGECAGILQGEMAAHPEAAIVFCFGVNDLHNIGAYIGWYQWFLSQYPERSVWFLYVNPIWDDAAASCGYLVRNYMITPFNDALRSTFPDKYIDTYTYLMNYGFGTGDGVHYDAATYQAIQNYTYEAVNGRV